MINSEQDRVIGREAEIAFGQRVRQLRVARGYSQDTAAEWMTAAGHPMSQNTFARLESGSRPTNVAETCALAMLFEVRIEHLIVTPNEAERDRLEGLRATLEQELSDLLDRQREVRHEIAMIDAQIQATITASGTVGR